VPNLAAFMDEAEADVLAFTIFPEGSPPKTDEWPQHESGNDRPFDR
jgi:hypothetical protein